MDLYHTKSSKLGATRYRDLIKQTRHIYHDIEKRTKRKPYIRSAYFNKEKIFFDYFWPHLDQKSLKDKANRLRYFPSGIELIQLSHIPPQTTINRHNKDELLHRFAGKTQDNFPFFVQIKERNGRKYLMSIFPDKQKSPAS